MATTLYFVFPPHAVFYPREAGHLDAFIGFEVYICWNLIQSDVLQTSALQYTKGPDVGC